MCTFHRADVGRPILAAECPPHKIQAGCHSIMRDSINVSPGQSALFEEAFAEAQTIVSSMNGYHPVEFRQSAGYREWRRRLHHFYDPGNATDRKSTRLNSSHLGISYAVFCLK